MPVLFCLLVGDLSIYVKHIDKRGPFKAEDIRAGERAVTSANSEGVDAFFDEVICSGEATLWSAE